MREALTYALQEYSGALVLVAHDRYLLKAVVNEFYLVDDRKVTKFTGDLTDYQRWLLGARKRQLEIGLLCKEVIKKKPDVVVDKKDAKVNMRRLNSLEAEIKKLHAEKERIAEILSGSEIYQQFRRSELEDCLKQSASVEKKIKELEEEWLGLL